MDPATHILEPQLEAYSLNRLAEDEAAIIEEHLLVCEQCRQQVSDLDVFHDSLLSALKEWGGPSMEDRREAVLRLVTERRANRRNE